MIKIKFDLQDPKELRLLAKLIDQCEHELHNDIQEIVNNSIRFLKDDYQFVFLFQYGEFESLTITKKGV